MNKGIGGHTKTHRGETDVWLTPPHIVPALGLFDLDPCAAPSPRPWSTATHHIELPDDGLEAVWEGRVWCNPPYGPEVEKWLRRLAEHGTGTALTFARTETSTWFKTVWPYASAILFLKGRLYFHKPNGDRGPGNAGGPSALITYGSKDAAILQDCGIPGKFIDLSGKK